MIFFIKWTGEQYRNIQSKLWQHHHTLRGLAIKSPAKFSTLWLYQHVECRHSSAGRLTPESLLSRVRHQKIATPTEHGSALFAVSVPFYHHEVYYNSIASATILMQHSELSPQLLRYLQLNERSIGHRVKISDELPFSTNL